MSDVLVEARWEGGLRFEATGKAGVPVRLDGDGKTAVTPVEALAVSLAACMGSDIADILAKGRVPLGGLTLRVEGDRRAEVPRRYTAMRLLCTVRGLAESHRPRLERAVALSREKYCSVLHTLRHDLEVSISIETG